MLIVIHKGRLIMKLLSLLCTSTSTHLIHVTYFAGNFKIKNITTEWGDRIKELGLGFRFNGC